MIDDTQRSFVKMFFKNFFFTLGIQVFFLIAAGLSYGFTGKVIYYDNIVIIGCILSVIANIILSCKSELRVWEKIVLILIMPTNFTYLLIYHGLGVKVLGLLKKLFKKYGTGL